jgi:hypothetical protein
MEREFMLFAFPWQADFEMVTENLQIKFIILQCDTNLNQGAFETIARFLFLVTKNKISFTHFFRVQIIATFGSKHVRDNTNNKETKCRSELTDGHMKSAIRAVSSNISPTTESLAQPKRCQGSRNSTR